MYLPRNAFRYAAVEEYLRTNAKNKKIRIVKAQTFYWMNYSY